MSAVFLPGNFICDIPCNMKMLKHGRTKRRNKESVNNSMYLHRISSYTGLSWKAVVVCGLLFSFQGCTWIWCLNHTLKSYKTFFLDVIIVCHNMIRIWKFYFPGIHEVYAWKLSCRNNTLRYGDGMIHFLGAYLVSIQCTDIRWNRRS